MTLPAPDALPAGEKTVGFWVEAVDREGRARYRQIIADPLAGMEMFEEDGTVTRVPRHAHEISIEVLVPDLPDIVELHLVSNPGDRERGRASRSVLKLRAAGPAGDGGGHDPH